MKNNFSDKVNDFAEWSKTAFTHFNNGFYADSLTNMRKSGEAACKIIFLHKFSEKISENKIGYKNYKELIELIIKDNLAPRKVINWLETLQIHGNEATHDTRIMQEQSYYGIIALRLLIYWLYIEFLKSTVPTALQKEISQIKEKSVDLINSKKVNDERNKLINEKEELEKKLNLLKGKENQENEKITNLTNELNISVTKIKELDIAQQKIVNLETELLRYKIEAEEFKQKQNPVVITKKRKFSKIITLASLSVILIIAGIFVIKNIRTHYDNAVTEKANAEIIKQQTDSFKILVYPFAILQDNPNIKINFEVALINLIRQKAQEIKLPLKIIYRSDAKVTLAKTDLFNEELKEKALMVIYGELYEPINNDSVQVNIKNVLTYNDGSPYFDETGIKAFSRLTDSSAIKIMQSVTSQINFAISDKYMRNKKYSEALALLYNTVPVTKFQKLYHCNFLAQCHSAMKNYNAAIIEMEKYIKLNPDNGYPYAYLAGIYTTFKDYGKADIYFQKSLQREPNNVNTILEYASMLVNKDFKNQHRSKALIEEAIQLDSANEKTWHYLADLENFMKDFKNAKKHYIKYIRMKPDNADAKKKLAAILAYQLNEPKQAVEYLSSILANDSNDVNVLFLLANIYTNTQIKNPSKAEYLFKKCKSLSKEANETDKGLGMAAYEKRDYNTALSCFLKAYALNKNDFMVCNYISEIYYGFKDYANAEKFLQNAYKLDSMNYLINYSAGFFYFNTPGKYQNIAKATYYFEKELKTNPYDTIVLQWLCTIYNNQKNIPKTKEICNKLKDLNSNSSFVHKVLGNIADLEGDDVKALFHYRKAVEITPQDEDCNYKIAVLLMKKSSEKYWKEALKYAGRAVAINPKSAECNIVYSDVLIYSGDYKKGHEYYNKALEINPAFKDTLIENVLKKRGF